MVCAMYMLHEIHTHLCLYDFMFWSPIEVTVVGV